MSTTSRSPSGGTTDELSHDRREQVLCEELERRLLFLEQANDSAFGDFTARDWLICTLLFFVLPLLLLGVMAL